MPFNRTAWLKANAEKIRAQKREAYRKDPAKAKAATRAWVARNPARAATYRRFYYASNSWRWAGYRLKAAAENPERPLLRSIGFVPLRDDHHGTDNLTPLEILMRKEESIS